jgi:hypothetical protein
MSFTTNVASDFPALRTALVAACTAAGWTWDSTANVLWKGNVFVRILATTTTVMSIEGGTGVSGGALTGAIGATNVCRMSGVSLTNNITWPVTYYIHIDPASDSVIMLINHGAYWQWMAFGNATNLGSPGNCAWFAASMRYQDGTGFQQRITVNANSNAGNGAFCAHCAIPFYEVNSAGMTGGSYCNSFIQTNIDGKLWANRDGASSGNNWANDTYNYTRPFMNRQPNVWNADAVLIPIKGMIRNVSPSFVQFAFELSNIRMVCISNYADGDIITIGSDKWKLYPARSKNLTVPDAGASDGNADHSGKYGIAVRYDGP